MPVSFLCVSDIHGEQQALGFLSEFIKVQKPDAVLLCGDLSDGSVAFAEELFETVERTKLPFYAVHGNNDPKAVPDFIAQSGHGIHLKSVEVNGVRVSGIGGSPKTPFFTECEYTEEEIASMLAKIRVDEKTLLVSHFPPKGCQADLVRGGVHAGSESLRKFTEEKKPAVVVCGHIHEQHLVEKIGPTVIAKVAPLFQRHAAVISMPSCKVTLL